MALLHYLNAHACEYGIVLSAVNCDHSIRGAASVADSEFVKNYCKSADIPLLNFKREQGQISEQGARLWRYNCFYKATQLFDGWRGADFIATAHHLSDNAETVLFNIARGSGLAGACGISECEKYGIEGGEFYVVRPLISVSRGDIDGYIAENNIPYVTDESNLTCDYTRNKLRHAVIPELEKAIPEAQRAIYRFSRIAAETERYFDELIVKNGIISSIYRGLFIKRTEERAVFSRAVLKVFTTFGLKDYTREHISQLYDMQFGENGKKFEFLGIIACKEDGGISVCQNREDGEINEVSFKKYLSENAAGFCGEPCTVLKELGAEYALTNEKILKFDGDKIPDGAVIRVMRSGDKFTKFGGGTKSLGDYFTDKKIPARLRGIIPLVADGNNVLIICGVEISDSVKITDQTKNIRYIICSDYKKM